MATRVIVTVVGPDGRAPPPVGAARLIMASKRPFVASGTIVDALHVTRGKAMGLTRVQVRSLVDALIGTDGFILQELATGNDVRMPIGTLSVKARSIPADATVLAHPGNARDVRRKPHPRAGTRLVNVLFRDSSLTRSILTRSASNA